MIRKIILQGGKSYRDEFAEDDPIPGMPPGRGDFVLPHAITFQGLVSSLAKVYRNPDQAFQDSLQNSRSMRNDLSVMECLEQRQRSCAMLNWHLEIDGEKQGAHADFLKQLTGIVAATGSSPEFAIRAKPFTEYRRSLWEADWYGKQGMQHKVGWKQIYGRQCLCMVDWEPVNGDKLCFRYDDGSGQYEAGQPGIRVRTSGGLKPGDKFRIYDQPTQQWKELKVENISGTEWTDRGLAYFLDADMQKQLVIHRYFIEDAAYEVPIAAGAIDGIGIRSRIYWTWFQKQETLSYLMEYLERSALGIEIWQYPAGNATVQAEIEAAATQRFANGRNVIFIPQYLNPDSGQTSAYDRVDPPAAGAETIKSVLTDFFGHQIKRYILGQTLTSEADSTGLGSKVADLHLGTYLDIVRYCCAGMEETLTNQLVRTLQRWNWTDTYLRNLPVKFVIDTQSDDSESKLMAWKQAYDMGAALPAKDIYPLIGAGMPGADDEVLQSPEARQVSQMQQQAMQASVAVPAIPYRDQRMQFGKPAGRRVVTDFLPRGNGAAKYPDNPSSDKVSYEPQKFAKGPQHAPKGGVTIGGQFYPGGEWIPGDVVEKATPTERKQLGSGKYDPKSQEVATLKLKPTKQRAFSGQFTPLKNPINKQAAGKIGEQILVSYLRGAGRKDARPMNTRTNNFPIDLIEDHEVIEAKTGQSGNSTAAQQWRLTIGEPGVKEKAALAKMSDSAKAKWNAKKQAKIHERKEAIVQKLEAETGKPIKRTTMTVILNPDTKTADIYKFDGWHDRVGWNSDEAKAGYIASVKYE
jgi:hypothetical protein